MCFYYDDGTWDFCEQSVRRARKSHRCTYCRRGILAGELYAYSAGSFDGDFIVEKICGACELDRYRVHILELGEG